MTLVTSYISSFLNTKKVKHFFGADVLAYNAILLLLLLASLIFFDSALFSVYGAFVQLLLGAIFILGNALALSVQASFRLSEPHNDYLAYLGFSKKQISLLALIIVFPASLLGVAIFYFLFTAELPFIQRLIVTLLSFVVNSLLILVFLAAQYWWRSRKRNGGQKALNKEGLFKAFKSPYRAFLTKDIHALRALDIIFSGVVLFLVIGVITVVATVQIPSLPVYCVCLYIFLVPLTGLLSFALYRFENTSYPYCCKQLRIRNNQIIRFKMPLQCFYILLVVCLFTLVVSLVRGITISELLVSFFILAYTMLSALSFSYWYVRRLGKGKRIDGIHEYASLAVSNVPGLAIIYLVVLLAKQQVDKTGRKERE